MLIIEEASMNPGTVLVKIGLALHWRSFRLVSIQAYIPARSL